MPQALTDDEIEETIEAFVLAAALAGAVGYDGVEIMGSEGYLINEFIAPAPNHRTDRWGGSYENRVRFPLEIVRRVRERVSPDFILIYRLSMLDLVPDGSTLPRRSRRPAPRSSIPGSAGTRHASPPSRPQYPAARTRVSPSA